MPQTPIHDAADAPRPSSRLWPWMGGPLLTLATLIALNALAATPWRIPNPGIIYFIPVIYSAYVGGLGPGFVSAAMTLVFSLDFFSRPGQLLSYTPEDARRLVAIFIAVPVVTLMTGLLKRREQRLSALTVAVRADARYRDLVEDLDGIVWEADPVTFRFSFVGGRLVDALGYPRSRWREEGDFWANHIHLEDRERSVGFCVAAVGRGDDHTFDYRMVTADGRDVWMRDRVSVIKDRDGKATLLRGVMTDITASVQAEQAQRSSEVLKAAIIEGALDCIVTMDHHGDVTDFNPAAERTFGYRRADVLGRPMAEIIVPPASRTRHREGLARYLATGEANILGQRLEMQAMRADSTEFPAELVIDRIPGVEPPMFTGFIRDITERRRADDAQRGTLSLLTATLESTTDGILVVDPEGRIVSYNRRFAVMWSLPQEVLDARDDDQAIGFVLSQLRDPDAFVAKVRELYAQPDAESFDVLEFINGHVFERYSMPRRLEGRSVGRVWSFRDVTERLRAEATLRESEEQLRQSQKMDAIGRLAGGVAHDFNNLLTVILGYSEQILERLKLPSDEPTRRAAGEILSAAERAAGLTSQLLAFSRKQLLEPRELDLNLTLTGTSRLLSRLIGEDIALEVKLEPDLGRVLADEGQIQQVVMNLTINARDAMPNGGRITLTTANAELDATFAQRHLPLTSGRYVMLTVSDTGIGMDAETRARVFEPFFTTKEPGKGTGLGLATVYGIIQQSGGHIWLYSEPGHGTTFKIYLPRLDSSSAGAETASVPDLPSRGTETVLLVEDESMVRNLLAGMLERNGYRVLPSASGEEAMTVATRYREPIHLMVTDVVMPGMGGPELADRLAPLHPELKVLYISGYTDDAVLRHGVREGLAFFLQKPFTLVALARKIRDVLDARSPA